MKVMVVSGSRAEYGLLSGPMRAIADAAELELALVLTGAHLESDPEPIRTAVRADGFRIDYEVTAGRPDDSARSIAEATGRITTGMAGAISVLKPDLMLVLGDRYEILAATTAAALMQLPVGHIHGGEATVGAIDDSLRNAITKLSHIHFTAAEEYRRRVIQMGEDPARVHNVGSPGIEQALKTPRASIDELWERIGIVLPEPFLLVTLHPETAGQPDPSRDVAELLAALEDSDAKGILFTGVNADTRRDEIAVAIDRFVSANADRSAFAESLGQRLYWTAVEHSAAVVGNSSSGLIETPVIGTPTVNIGTRQAGRLRAPSVLDCEAERGAISAAIERALRRDVPLAGDTPYGSGDTSRLIAEILSGTDVAALSTKPFYDLPAGGLAA